MRILILIAIYIFLFYSLVTAELYKFVDKDGKIHYTNTAPPQSAKNIESTYEEHEDHHEGEARIDKEIYGNGTGNNTENDIQVPVDPFAQNMGWYFVEYEDSKCVVLLNNYGYTLVEIYTGVPIKGMNVMGEVNTIGVKKFYDQNGSIIFSGFIDDFALGETRAIEKIRNKCRPR